MKKRWIAGIAGLLCMVMILGGCGGGSGSGGDSGQGSAKKAKPVDLKMNVTTSESSVWMVAAKEFKRLVEEGTDGRYTVSIFPNEQLSAGDMPKGVEQLFNGTTDLDIHSLMLFANVEPKVIVCSMPWLFPDGYKSVDDILFNGPGKDALMKLIRAKGVEPLALGENGFRQITNNVRPIKEPKDLDRLKIRVPAISMYIDLFKLLGADPTSMSWSEVFTALQQGTIDGQENPYDTIRSGQIQEVQKYMTIWNYSYDPIVLSVSNKVWNGLSDADKAVFKDAAEKACAKEVQESRKMDSQIIDEFKKGGMEVTELTPDQTADFKKKADPIYKMYKDQIGEDLLKEFGYNFQ